jgi:hypothetical protein
MKVTYEAPQITEKIIKINYFLKVSGFLDDFNLMGDVYAQSSGPTSSDNSDSDSSDSNDGTGTTSDSGGSGGGSSGGTSGCGTGGGSSDS